MEYAQLPNLTHIVRPLLLCLVVLKSFSTFPFLIGDTRCGPGDLAILRHCNCHWHHNYAALLCSYCFVTAFSS